MLWHQPQEVSGLGRLNSFDSGQRHLAQRGDQCGDSDKQPSSLSSRSVCTRCTVADPKNLYSRVPSRFPRQPSFFLGPTDHHDSWEADRNDEIVSRCCWIPPQCVYAGAPTEASWGLWKEGMMGTGEALRVTNLKDQASSNARPEISSQFPKMNKLDRTLPYLPQDSKTKGQDFAPPSAPAPTQTQPYPLTHSTEHPTTHTPEHNPAQVQALPHSSARPKPASVPVPIPEPTPPHCDTHIPPHASAPILADTPTLPPTPSPTPDHAPSQTSLATPAPVQEQTSTQAPLPIQVSAPTPARSSAAAQAPAYVPAHSQGHHPIYTSAQTWTHSQTHSPEQTSTQGPVCGSSRLIHSLAQPLAPAPTFPIPGPTPACTSSSTLKPYLTFSLATPPSPVLTSTPANGSALAKDDTTTPTVSGTAPNPNLIHIPPTLETFGSSLSTGHVVYDARRAKQNMIHKCDPQNAGYSRKELSTSSRPQEGQSLVNSGTSEKTSKQHGGDSTEPEPLSGSILGYLELGNMEWKISEDTKDKSCQPQTFPYCSFHPCSSEKKNTDVQVPVYPKFLVFTQDAASKPCLHSPSTTQNSVPTIPPPCTLSLPLVPPRTFVLPQPSNHPKPSNLTQTPASKSSLSVPASHFPIPPQFSTKPQFLLQPQCSESKTNTPNHGLQRTSGFSKDSRVARNPGPTQNPDLHERPSLIQDPYLCKNPILSQDSGLHVNPESHTNQETGLLSSLGPTQDSGVLKTPCHPQPSGLCKNVAVTQTSRLQGCMQDSRDYRNVGLNQDTAIYKSQDLSSATDPKRPGCSQDSGGYKRVNNTQDPGVYKNIGCVQDSRPQKSSGCIQDSEVNKSSELAQESGPHKSPGFVKRSCLHKSSNQIQDSGDYKNSVLPQGVYRMPGLTQDSNCHRSVDLTQASEVEKRLNCVQDAGVYRNQERSQNSNLHKCSEINKCPHKEPYKELALVQNSGHPQPLGLTQKAGLHRDSCFVPDPSLHKSQSCLPGMSSTQVLSSHQTQKPISSPVKSGAYEMPLQKEETEQHVSWSIPDNPNPCPSNTQAITPNLQTFSEVPVLVEVKPSSWRTGSQDWVYHSMGTVPSACQNYRRIPMPPKNNWRPHCPGPGTRAGHVVFDARQKHLAVGRDKCEALSPRRFYQESPSNSGENLKEWGNKNVMRTLQKERTNVHRE
ncbi:uncharacterized protein SPEM3 isoform 2-T2 [Thomomys bottae]